MNYVILKICILEDNFEMKLYTENVKMIDLIGKMCIESDAI